MILLDDTIAAISTPLGSGGIAIIRISGAKSVLIADMLFQGKNPLSLSESHRAHHGWILDEGEPVDEVVVTVFKGPNSYTGEDVVEISCHGGYFVSRNILERVVKKGARPALPGEFTRRAFVNGKMDLSQAEAVAELIQAKTEASRKVAAYQLQGGLSKRIQIMKEKMIHACSRIELELDFGEEKIELVSREELKKILASILQEIRLFIRSFERGRICREGLRAVIVGRPNVGKSSVLNALLERERAIVAESPGTTRDTVEDVLDLEGLQLNITDTAGLRQTRDTLEMEGVKRTEKAIETADLIILVFDGSQKLQKEDEDLIRRFNRTKKHVLIVINKIDLTQKLEVGGLNKLLKAEKWIEISALQKKNIDMLIEAIKQSVLSGGLPNPEEIILTNTRHRDKLETAEKWLIRAMETLEKGMSQEFIAMEMRGAMDDLEEILGKTTPDDILNKIFSEFCIGK